MSRKSSPVWDYFSITADPLFARCSIGTCNQQVKIGKSKSTHGLWTHLELSHKKDYDLAKKEQQEKSLSKASKSTPAIFSLRTTEDLGSSGGESSHSTAVQPKMQEFFSPTDKYKKGHPKQKELTYLLAEWLADAMLPFTTVDNPRFRVLVEAMHPKYILHTESHYRKVIFPDIYRRVRAAVGKIIANEVEFCSVTCDLWSSRNQQSYVSLTIHFIDSNWNRKTAILSCKPVYERHTAENILASLQEILTEWGLLDKVHIFVRDSGSNIIAALEKGGFEAAPCYCHTLQLVVNSGILAQRAIIDMTTRLGKFVKYFRKSTVAKVQLEKMQKDLKLPKHTLIKGEPTRWSSYLRSMKRALEQKVAICAVTPDLPNLNNDQKMLDNDWILMQQVVSLLQPFADATVFGERESACISEIIPATFKLKKQLEKVDPRGAYTMLAELQDMILNYFEGGYASNHNPKFRSVEWTDIFAIATLLDPRFKSKAFQDAQAASNAQNRLEKLVFNEIKASQSSQEAAATEPPVPKRAKFSGFFAELAEELTTTTAPSGNPVDANNDEGLRNVAKSVVSAYLRETLINSESDPLSFWKMKEIEMPVLAKLAKKFLSAPMSSASSEREFKVASDITAGDRIKLLPENTERLLFLKYNLRAIGYNSFHLPLPPTPATQEEMAEVMSVIGSSDEESSESSSDNEEDSDVEEVK